LASFYAKIKKKTLSKIENRFDISLVRLGFFKTLSFSRLAITRGLMLINFKKIKNTNFILKKKDLIFLSLKNYALMEKFLNEKHFFFESGQKFFIFKKRANRFIKKKYLNCLFSFFKNADLNAMTKSSLLEAISLNTQ
jgi:ribosomal protein S4